MNIAFEQSSLEFQELNVYEFAVNKIRLTIARLDKLHAEVSGNKLFKLHYFLEEALSSPHKKIITFGGAYSNHLVATAFACQNLGIQSVGVVRREKHEPESHTTLRCTQLGMKLVFISRADYKHITDTAFLQDLKIREGDCTIVPEGGYHPLGAKGASLIMERMSVENPTHVCVPVGTATTIAGLLVQPTGVQIVGVPVIKNMTDISDRIRYLTGMDSLSALSVLDGFHFGGYARSSNELIEFMNQFYKRYRIPLDFVYTAKMMFGIFQKIQEGYFPAGSRIVCLHTGGLQGNKSLQPYNLTF